MKFICKTKSQASIFVLFGLVIAIAAVFIVNIDALDVKEKDITSPSFDMSPVKLFVESCISDTGKKALVFVGGQSGYYDLKEPYLKDENFNLSYYYIENLDIVPTIETLQNEISGYMDDNLLSCINDFSEFREMGYEIGYSDLRTGTIIGEEGVYFSVNFPTTVKKGTETTRIDDYSAGLDRAPLRNLNKISKEIVSLQLEDPTSICLSCLYDLGEKYNFYPNVIDYTDTILIFDIRVYNTSTTEIYNFTFAVKYKKIFCNNLAYADDVAFTIECVERAKEND